MANLNDRVDKLRGRFPRPDPEEERRWREAVRDCDEIARIIASSSRDEFKNRLAVIQERWPDMSAYEQQLLVKKQLLLASGPDGQRLWQLLHSAIDDGRRPGVRDA